MKRKNAEMVSEKRFKVILDEVNRRGIVTVREITELLGTSDATTRRDFAALAQMGKLIKFHGGAKKLENDYILSEEDYSTKQDLNIEQKQKIARYAATLIRPRDFIYIDAGTSTFELVKQMKDIEFKSEIGIVTNAITHAAKLSRYGYGVHVLEGDIKASTEAIVGDAALSSIEKFNFTKAFMGTNGVHNKAGHTTYDLKESTLKNRAIANSREVYFLADDSKFGKVAPLSFARLDEGEIITTELKDDSYNEKAEITEVGK